MRIFRSTTGINNKVDPARHKFNSETGVTELTAGINIEIDRYGGIDRRLGQSVVVDDVFHSGYCNGGDAYVVQDRTNDAAIYQVATDDTLTGIASGLTKGYRVSFWQVGEKTYWMNGAQQGMLYQGGSYAWPTVSTHVGVESSAEYYPAPLGTHICVFMGRMCVVVGNVIYVSEPYSYGEFRMAARYWQFASDVTMVKPVAGGLWVSDSDQIGFIQASEKFEAMTWVKKASVPAHEWSECIMLADISQTVFQVPGLSALWSSNEGLCIGSEAGQLIIATKDKLTYPTGGTATTVLFNDTVINSIGQTTISESSINLISNGSFDSSTTGWTGYLADLSIDTGRMKVTNTSAYGRAYRSCTAEPGGIYNLTFDYEVGTSSGGGTATIRDADPLTGTVLALMVSFSAGARKISFKASSSVVYTILQVQSSTVGHYSFFDNVSLLKTSNLVVNGEFSRDALFTKGTGWTISGGKANAAAGTASSLSPNPAIPIVVGERYVVTYTAIRTGGSITPTIGGVTLATCSASGTYPALITALTTANLSFDKDASFAGSLDDVSAVPYNEYDGTLPITT